MKNLFIFFFYFPVLLLAQLQSPVTQIPFTMSGRLLENPLSGGMNTPVFSPIDADGDGKLDIFVYDKAAWKGQIYLNKGCAGHPKYIYAPQYDNSFPAELRDWAVIRDYDGDGMGDIFALTSGADIAVFKGYRSASGGISFQKVKQKLTYRLGNFDDHIWTFSDNMPAFYDVDHDGDMDVVTPDINQGITFNFYKNVSVDRGYGKDSLIYELDDQCFGRIMLNQVGCGLTLAACKKDLKAPSPAGNNAGRHQGSALYGFDYEGDHDMDLLVSDIFCTSMKYLQNDGDTSYSSVQHYDTLFPSYDVPVNVTAFPAAYGIDVDNDARTDLLVSPFAANNYQQGVSEDIHVIDYYHNQALTPFNKYHYEGDTFMTQGIIDLGSESHPAFFDYNGDGLMDIVVGNYGRHQRSGGSKSGLALYQNVGSDTMPKFNLVTEDWNNLSALGLNGMYPTFGDIDGDGKIDMLVGDINGKINFFKNTSTTATASYPAITAQAWMGLDAGENSTPCLYDVNNDGLLDLVAGNKTGRFVYYWNYGSTTAPLFSMDSSNPNFGNMRVNNAARGINTGYSTPLIYEGKLGKFVYSGSERGLTFKYQINPDSLRSGSFILLDSNLITTNPGQRSNVAIADLNNDGFYDYLTGNIRGGLMLCTDNAWAQYPNASGANPCGGVNLGVLEREIVSNDMEVFPIPAKDKIMLRLADESKQILTTELINLIGEVVNSDHTLINNTAEIDTRQQADGIYILQAIDSDHKLLYQRKIAIIK